MGQTKQPADHAIAEMQEGKAVDSEREPENEKDDDGD